MTVGKGGIIEAYFCYLEKCGKGEKTMPQGLNKNSFPTNIGLSAILCTILQIYALGLNAKFYKSNFRPTGHVLFAKGDSKTKQKTESNLDFVIFVQQAWLWWLKIGSKRAKGKILFTLRKRTLIVAFRCLTNKCAGIAQATWLLEPSILQHCNLTWKT